MQSLLTRRDAPRRLHDRRAGARHGPQRRARVDVLPEHGRLLGRRFQEADDKDLALVMLQAYNDWHIDEWCGSHPGRFIPLAIGPVVGHGRDWSPRCKRVGRQGVPGDQHARAAAHPGPADLPERLLEPVLDGRVATRTSSCASTSAWGSTPSTWVPTSRSTTTWCCRRRSRCCACRTCCGARPCASTRS